MWLRFRLALEVALSNLNPEALNPNPYFRCIFCRKGVGGGGLGILQRLVSFLVAEFLSPQKCTLLVLLRVLLPQKSAKCIH